MDVDAAKRRAAEAAAERVDDGTVVGLGTGSTAAHAIRALGRRVDGGLDVRGVPTSHAAAAVARDAGVPLTELEAGVDVAIDGADAVTGDGTLRKGGGAAHVRERIVASDADRLHVVVDARKPTDRIDDPIPLAVLPRARPAVERRVAAAGGEPSLRAADRKSGPVVTDDGMLVVDADFGRIDEPQDLATTLDAIPGVLGHGLFVRAADRVFVGDDDGVTVRTP